jgi:hypothetical protein
MDFPWDVGRNYWGQIAIATSFFQRADEYQVAKKIHSSFQQDGRGGRIKVLAPPMMEIAREELQLDALFRVASRLLTEGYVRNPFNRINSKPLAKTFAEVAAKDHRLATTSKDRLAALRGLVDYWNEEDRHSKMKYLDRWIYDALMAFLPTAAAMFENGELCEVDEKALASLKLNS